jgi:hypothetical protein
MTHEYLRSLRNIREGISEFGFVAFSAAFSTKEYTTRDLCVHVEYGDFSISAFLYYVIYLKT